MQSGGTGGTSTGTSGASPGTGGASGASAGTGGTSGFVDQRPARPQPDLPFIEGDPGWRDSDDLVCVPPRGNAESFDIWADERGVFVVASTACDMSTLDAQPIPCGQQGVSVQHNAGSGWETLYEIGPKKTEGTHNRELRVRGVPNGPLVLAGVLDELHHGVSFLDDGVLTPQPEAATESARVFVAGERIYSLAVGPEMDVIERTTRILMYDAGDWSELVELSEPVRDLWANETLVSVVGANQAFLIGDPETGEFEQLPGVPAGDYNAVWGFGADDLWAGNTAGQLVHYDGENWRVVQTGASADYGIQRLWGVSGRLYFTTANELGRFDGEKVELLVTPDEAPELDLTFTGLWGLSENEVFLSLLAGDYDDYRCSSYFAAWFDGEELHLF